MSNPETAAGVVPTFVDPEVKNLETSKILAVFSDSAQSDAARVALLDVGFSDASVGSYGGPEGQRDLDLKGEHHGVWHHLQQQWHHVMLVEGLQLVHYEKELEAGNWIVQVHTDSNTWELAHSILKSSGGRFINFYGLLLTKVLES